MRAGYRHRRKIGKRAASAAATKIFPCPAKRAISFAMREKELRFALICYGGISLAVYMHGITKEVWRLSAASRAFHDDAAPSGSGAVFGDLLAPLIARCGVPLTALGGHVLRAGAGGRTRHSR